MTFPVVFRGGGVQKPSLNGAELQVYRDNPQPLQPWRRTRKMEACHLPLQRKDSCGGS